MRHVVPAGEDAKTMSSSVMWIGDDTETMVAEAPADDGIPSINCVAAGMYLCTGSGNEGKAFA